MCIVSKVQREQLWQQYLTVTGINYGELCGEDKRNPSVTHIEIKVKIHLWCKSIV
jgi:hypothetical protein